jgi:ATP-dependent DNA ligase
MSIDAKAAFIPPMLLLPTDKLPEDPAWLFEIKCDRYRAIAFKEMAESNCVRATTRISPVSIR